MAVLNINLGLKSYEICDTDGNTVGVIRFNPSDPGMVSRWKEVQEFINGFDEKEYNTPEKIGEADRAIKEKFNYAFGTDVSSVLFQNGSGKRAGGCAAHHRRGDEGCAKELGSSRACAHSGI